MNYRLPNPTSDRYGDNYDAIFGRLYCRLCRAIRAKSPCFKCNRECIPVEPATGPAGTELSTMEKSDGKHDAGADPRSADP